MEVLYHQSQKLVLDIQGLLPHIERNVGKDAASIEQTIHGKLEEITRYCVKSLINYRSRSHSINSLHSNIQRLDILVNKELPVRRREARFKVDQLKQDRLMLQVCIYYTFQFERTKGKLTLSPECNPYATT